MKYLLVLCFFVFQGSLSFGQDAVYKQQLETAYAFMWLLEANKPAEGIKLIDVTYLNAKKNYLDTLKAYSKELSGYLKTTRLSIVGVFPEEGSNTFRCRYGNQTGDYFYIDLYMDASNPRSAIKKIVKVPSKVLEKDRKELARAKEYEKKHGVPQPPPPPGNDPPGVTIFPKKKN